jgi:hypothetical protein
LPRRNGLDPSSTAQLVQTTIAREMFLDSGEPLLPTPTPVTTNGKELRVWSVNCLLAQKCLTKSPDARATALKLYPADATIELKLFADARNNPTRMEIKSEFLMGGATNVVSVNFRAAFDFHALGKQVAITPPAV